MAGGAELRRDGVLRTLPALAVLIVGLCVAHVGGVEFRASTFWLIQNVLDIAFVVFGTRLVTMLVGRPLPRRFWRLVTFGGLFYIVGDTSQIVVLPGVSYALVADLSARILGVLSEPFVVDPLSLSTAGGE